MIWVIWDRTHLMGVNFLPQIMNETINYKFKNYPISFIEEAYSFGFSDLLYLFILFIMIIFK